MSTVNLTCHPISPRGLFFAFLLSLNGGCELEPVAPTISTCSAVMVRPRLAPPPEFEAAASTVWELLGGGGIASDRQPTLALLPEGELEAAGLEGLACVIGETDVAFVSMRVSRPSGTSLAHEFMHFSIGHNDPDHLSPRWGQELDDVTRELRDLGL